jgi:ABC-type Fe3+-citrate transport system substrate-binding protein
MTQIVKVDFTGPKSVTPLTALDALSKEAQSVVDIRERIKKFLEAEPHTLEDADKRIAELQALRPSEQRLAGLTTQTDHGLSRATSEQIQEQLALLLGAFPSSNTPDPMVYSRMMLNEVLAAEPSVIALTMACSELRRTLQWPPSIADVLKAIREQEMRWQYRLRCASAIVDDHAEALSKLLERRAWLARPDAEKEAERKEHLARMESLRQLLRGVVAKRTGKENEQNVTQDS